MTVAAAVPQQRIAWVDVARGIGITLVVVGHVLRGLITASILAPSATSRFVDDWIYSFHMPLFFFLSGLFGPRTIDLASGPFLSRLFRTIAYPYFLWSLLQTSTQIVLSRYTNQPADFGDLLQIGWKPVMQFWFLYALFVIFLAAHLLRRIGLSYRAIAWSSVAIFCLSRWISLGSWGVAYEAVYNLPFFALGAAGTVDSASRLLDVVPRVALARGVLGFAVLGAVVASGESGVSWVAPPLALCGIFACLQLAAVCARRAGFALVAFAGRHSLEIYVAHTLATAAVRIGLSSLLGIKSPLIHISLGVAAGLLLPLALVLLCERAGLRFVFAWPQRRRLVPALVAS
jgi:fucose 4-O-acetylase-like acetyltransferase